MARVGPQSGSSHLGDDAVGFAALETVGHLDAHHAEHGLPKIAKIDVFFDDVPLVLDAQPAAAAEHGRQMMIVVGVDRAATAAPDHHGVVQQVAVPLLDGLQAIEEIRQLFPVVRIDDRPPFKFVGILAVVRHGVIAVGITRFLAIRPPVLEIAILAINWVFVTARRCSK